MEEAIIKALASAGPFAILFFWALYDKSQLTKQVMQDSKEREDRLVVERQASEKKSQEREEKLMICLDNLSLQYGGLCRDIDETKDDISGIKGDLSEVKQDIKILKDRGK